MSAGDDLEANSWPGFVDILSAAIIMFVFFVLITAVALFFHVITFKSKEDTSAQIESTQQQAIIELEEQNEELREKIAGLNAKILETDNTFSETEGTQRLSFSKDGMTMYVFFGTNSITITEDTDLEVKKFVASVLGRHNANNLKLRITAGKTTSAIETIARKVAVARIFNVRNAFLDTPINKQSVYLNVEAPQMIEDDYDWAKIQFVPQR